MTLRLTPLAELNKRAYKLLLREWGVVDTLRFFNQLGLGVGDYTEERRALFADLTLNEYREAVQKLPASKSRELAPAKESDSQS